MNNSVNLMRSLVLPGKGLRLLQRKAGRPPSSRNTISAVEGSNLNKTCPGFVRSSIYDGSRNFTSVTSLNRSGWKGGDNELDASGSAFVSNQFAREFGSFEKVVPAKVNETIRKIPEHIKKPDYWKTGHPLVHLGPQRVEIKSEDAIKRMRKSCTLAKEVLATAMSKAKPGVTTQEIDDFVFNYTIELGAYPSPLNYKLFPKSVCTSVNNVACHGIPDSRPLVDGDIVNIDVMVYFDGYHGDCSDTVVVGDVDDKGKKLVEAARTCLHAGISVCGPGVPFNKIGQKIEQVADRLGFTVVPCFTGHGIGEQIHTLPDIYHFDYPYPGTMQPGQTFTIEPVITQGMEDIVILEDGWTAVTVDGSRTAQSEHTVLVTKSGVEILT